ncbi:MAG: hypothetical protein HGB19_01550, partial [Chlorobiales bacterium]|nr:hypothetical protein [Chlorobiales bacterium]
MEDHTRNVFEPSHNVPDEQSSQDVFQDDRDAQLHKMNGELNGLEHDKQACNGVLSQENNVLVEGELEQNRIEDQGPDAHLGADQAG